MQLEKLEVAGCDKIFKEKRSGVDAGRPELKRCLEYLRDGDTDDVVANISAGVDVIGAAGSSLRLYYDGRFGDTIEENAAGAKATVPF